MLLLFLVIPFTGYALMLVVARSLARAKAPDPPHDGSTGPWCLSCRYSLAGIASGATCPECGRSKRFTFPTPSPHATMWVLLALLTSILSHIPVLIARLSNKSVPPMIYTTLVAEAFFVAMAMLILVSRLRGRTLLLSLLAMTLPQLLVDTLSVVLINTKLPDSTLLFVFLI